MQFSLTAIVLAVTIAFLLLLAGIAWRFRQKYVANLFGILQALSAIWATLALIGLQLPTGDVRLQVWGFTNAMSLIVVAFWLAFILAYTGRDRLLRLDRLGVTVVPLVVGAGLYAIAPAWPPLVGAVEQATIPAGTVVQGSVGPVGSVLGGYIYLVFLAGLLLVLKSMVEGNSLFVGQAIALVLGTIATVVASFFAILGIPESGYPITEVALGTQSLFWGYAVFGQQLLRVVPAVATIGERAIFDHLDAGVIVVDNDGTITRVNPSARSYLDLDSAVGSHIQPILDRMAVSTLDELPTRFEFGGQTYRARTSPIENWRGTPVGRAVLIQDVTQLFRRQQGLQVLNRILRHNLRNDMNVVLGMSEQLRQREDDDLVRMSETLSETAEDLVEISEKAIELGQIFEGVDAVDDVNLEDFLGRVVSPLAARYPDATITTDISADSLRTDWTILSLVLEEVLTNALEHGGDAPTVAVTIFREDERVTIAVSDDGPGIPRAEIDPIIAGEETKLEHASSLGLWLVYWGTRTLDGDLDITAADGGSTVSITLPDM